MLNVNMLIMQVTVDMLHMVNMLIMQVTVGMVWLTCVNMLTRT